MRAAGYIRGASRPKGGTPLPRQVYDWCLSSVAEVGGALNRQGLLVKCQHRLPFRIAVFVVVEQVTAMLPSLSALFKQRPGGLVVRWALTHSDIAY
jgi:hypothetical protein